MTVAFGDVASGEERRPERGDPAGRDAVEHRQRSIPGNRTIGEPEALGPDPRRVAAAQRRAGDVDAPAPHRAERRRDRDGGLLDARHRENALVDALVRRETRGRREVGAARVDHREQDAAALEAERHLRQSDKRPQEQAGADEEHEREGDLRQDEPAGHRRVARGARGPSAILHCVDGRATGRAPRRRHAEDERRDEAGGRGEREHAPVQRQLQRHGVRGELRDEEPAAPMSHGHTGRRAHRREQQAFDQQLARQPSARRAQREAHAPFVAPRGRAGEQQVGNVGAGNQQHQSHDGHQDQQRP